jgi:hypothetical protein
MDRDEAERRFAGEDHEPIHVYVPGSVDDPRDTPSIPGVVIHRGPPLHPDDVTTHLGIPVTSLPDPDRPRARRLRCSTNDRRVLRLKVNYMLVAC